MNKKNQTIISINQPAYLPWLGYFDRIANSDHHIVLDHVQFEKNSMVNRNKLLSKNGEVMLTVPVKTSGNFGNLAISTIQIGNQPKWQKKHWQSIYFNYKKAPYFEQYAKELEAFYNTSYLQLNDLLKAQLAFFLKVLKIETKISYSSEYVWHKNKSDLVQEICQYFKATQYISGIHGEDYLNTQSFLKEGILVDFQHYQHPCYSQMKDTFTSHLSILDLLFNHGDKSLEILRNSQ
ncbi:WbqC family protein [Colwelliaceae bacterium 6441]